MEENNTRGFKKIRPWLILFIIIAAELCYTTYCFVNYKQGLHSDEIWCYGLANSYYQPFIYMQDDILQDDMTDDDIINYNEWVSGNVINDYITVQDGERFAYGSVYHNNTLDCHPPFYYMLLHTVCSLFPNSFSLYYSYFLNCIFLVLTQLFLFKLAKLLLRSDYLALLVCVLYGGGTGALSTFVFLRQYSLLTALVVMYTYFNAALFFSEDFDLKKRLPPIAVTAFLAFMTHYYAIAYIGIFTACFCVYFLCKRRIKKMFIYGGTVLLCLALFVAAWPAVYTHMTRHSTGSVFSREYGFGFWTQLRVIVKYITYYNFGIYVSVYKSSFRYVVIAIVFSLAILSLPVCFLFRKEPWFIAFKARIKDKTIALIKKVPDFLRNASYMPLFIFLAVVGEVFTANVKTDVILMGDWAMRYIFCVFPLSCLLAFIIVRIILSRIFIPVLKRLPKLKIIPVPAAAILTAVAVIAANVNTSCKFWFDSYGDIDQIYEDLEGKNCLIVMPDMDSFWLLTNFTHYVNKANAVFVTTAEELADQMEYISETGGVDFIMITKANYGFSEIQSEYFSEKYNLDTYEEEETDSVTVMVDEGADDLFSKDYEDCTNDINSLAEVILPEYSININGMTFYLLESSQ